MISAEKNPQVINDYLSKELEAGNILGPFQPPAAPKAHINRFGVIPKKYQTGKWWLITDLSSPDGGSVNDGINSERCSMDYTTVDQVVARAVSLGKGVLLAKIDIKSAYRLMPICPRDHLYLDMQWKEAIYLDGVQHMFHYLHDRPRCSKVTGVLRESLFSHVNV